MPRKPRLVVPGVPHHITQRGVDRKPIFLDDDDRTLYLRLLEESADSCHLRIWGYCLMPNHVHLIVVPDTETSLWKPLSIAHSNYARYFNQKRGGCGHLWQGRYFSTAMDQSHRWWALAYVEQNPVRAGLARVAKDYPWSSAQEHLGLGRGSLTLDHVEWRAAYDSNRWSEVLRSSILDEAMSTRFREATRTGHPLGDKPFVDRIAAETGRQVDRLKTGPRAGIPRKPPARLAMAAGVNQMSVEFGS